MHNPNTVRYFILLLVTTMRVSLIKALCSINYVNIINVVFESLDNSKIKQKSSSITLIYNNSKQVELNFVGFRKQYSSVSWLIGFNFSESQSLSRLKSQTQIRAQSSLIAAPDTIITLGRCLAQIRDETLQPSLQSQSNYF